MGNVCENPGTNPKFHVEVKCGDDSKIYSIEKGETVGDLKKKIEANWKHKVGDQTLSQCDVELDDAQEMDQLKLEVHDQFSKEVNPPLALVVKEAAAAEGEEAPKEEEMAAAE